MQNYSMYEIFYPLIKAGTSLFFYDATTVLQKFKKIDLKKYIICIICTVFERSLAEGMTDNVMSNLFHLYFLVNDISTIICCEFHVQFLV